MIGGSAFMPVICSEPGDTLFDELREVNVGRKEARTEG